MMLRRLGGLVLMLGCWMTFGSVPRAHASGAWQTYLRMYSCNDMIAGRDTVWIASGEAGLLRYLRSVDRFESYTREPRGLASNSLTALAYDRSGRLWVGTPGKGVSRLSKDLSTWDLVNAFDGLPSDSITVLEADGDTMWVGTTRGIALWNGREIAGSVPDLGTPSPFSSNDVKGIVVYGDTLFVAVANGIYLSRLSNSFREGWAQVNTGLVGLNVTGLAGNGSDVFALANGAVFRWVSQTGQWSLVSSNGSVRRLRDDFGHVLNISSLGIYEWVGSQFVAAAGAPGSDNSGDGAVEMTSDPLGKVFAVQSGSLREQATPTWIPHRVPGPVGNDVTNVLATSTGTYVCTLQEGVGRIRDGIWRNWYGSDPTVINDTTFINPNFTFSLIEDRLGRKWIGSWDRAIERFDDSGPTPSFEHLFATPFAVDTLRRHTFGWASTIDDSGYVYIGFDTPDRGSLEPAGIDVYAPDGTLRINWKTNNASLGDNQVRALAVDKYGYLWAGFPGSGVRNTALRAIPGRDSLPLFGVMSNTTNLDIFGIATYGDSVWVLTTSNLLRFRAASTVLRTQNAITLTIPAGPAPRGAVRPIDVGPDGSVWVGTVDGVRRYRPGGVTEDFRVDNSPLADIEVRAVSVDKTTGVVWFGTASGVNRFDPAYVAPIPPQLPRLTFNVYPNPAWLTGAGIELRIQGNATAYGGEIHDLTGRLLRHFSADANGRVIWDGRDDEGSLVPAGVYFVHARGGGRESTARVVVLR